MVLNSAFTKLSATLALGGILLLAPATASYAADDRCTGPCPERADCECAKGDIPLVLVNGKWVKKVVVVKKKLPQSALPTHKLNDPMPMP